MIIFENKLKTKRKQEYKKIGKKIPPLANGALCLRTPKSNGKSGHANIF
jgi:hypothetical protein